MRLSSVLLFLYETKLCGHLILLISSKSLPSLVHNFLCRCHLVLKRIAWLVLSHDLFLYDEYWWQELNEWFTLCFIVSSTWSPKWNREEPKTPSLFQCKTQPARNKLLLRSFYCCLDTRILWLPPINKFNSTMLRFFSGLLWEDYRMTFIYIFPPKLSWYLIILVIWMHIIAENDWLLLLAIYSFIACVSVTIPHVFNTPFEGKWMLLLLIVAVCI